MAYSKKETFLLRVYLMSAALFVTWAGAYVTAINVYTGTLIYLIPSILAVYFGLNILYHSFTFQKQVESGVNGFIRILYLLSMMQVLAVIGLIADLGLRDTAISLIPFAGFIICVYFIRNSQVYPARIVRFG